MPMIALPQGIVHSDFLPQIKNSANTSCSCIFWLRVFCQCEFRARVVCNCKPSNIALYVTQVESSHRAGVEAQ